jgi:hypothetical protein
MLKRKACLTAALLIASLPGLAQHGDDGSRGQDRSRNDAAQNSHDNRGRGNNRNQQHRGNQNFYSGVREGGRGGQYYDPRHANDGYDERYNQRRGGIGPGKGALIGGAGGAALGAVLGGGLKGSLIGGAAGAGIGAVVGNATQNGRRDSHQRR